MNKLQEKCIGAYAQTFHYLESLYTCVDVPWYEFRTSVYTLFSIKFNGCSALALQNEKIGSLAHIGPDQHPESLIDEMIREINTKPQDITAIIDSGGSYGLILRHCIKRGIKVNVHHKLCYLESRDVILTPSRRELRIYTGADPEILHFP